MRTETRIQAAVAWADLILCQALRWAVVIAVLGVVVLVGAVAVRRLLGYRNLYSDEYLIDYDAPGVDITSEGPD